MKFDCEEVAPSGRPVLKLRLGAEELDIVKGLVKQALIHTPRTATTESMISRLKAMARCLDSVTVAEWIRRGDSTSENAGSTPAGDATQP